MKTLYMTLSYILDMVLMLIIVALITGAISYNILFPVDSGVSLDADFDTYEMAIINNLFLTTLCNFPSVA